jgi:hypothetical protein
VLSTGRAATSVAVVVVQIDVVIIGIILADYAEDFGEIDLAVLVDVKVTASVFVHD